MPVKGKRMRYILVIFLLFCNVSKADSNSYNLYANKSLGISLEYPKGTEVEDQSSDIRTKVWFHVGEWPERVKYTGNKPPRSPVSGILFQQESQMNFDKFIENERKEQEVGGYRDQIIETKFDTGNGIRGIEFVRTVEPINKNIHHLIFHIYQSNIILSLWHVEDTETGFMSYPELEKKALGEYDHMKHSLKILR
ncbi:MAG: hypothetical protein DBP01_17445 [gamma proteobacterium symbiont of Ctena orbiculata]|nr:MAG: hypothetical protein DBP01_17445 [gamma proteobacterium symbiont of Ctena orbiculata]